MWDDVGRGLGRGLGRGEEEEHVNVDVNSGSRRTHKALTTSDVTAQFPIRVDTRCDDDNSSIRHSHRPSLVVKQLPAACRLSPAACRLPPHVAAQTGAVLGHYPPPSLRGPVARPLPVWRLPHCSHTIACTPARICCVTLDSMAEKKMQLVDWLDDLCVRFIINLPEEELNDVARICFQVEEAQWFYEDFIRPTDPSLPSLHLRDFCLRIFQHCPLLSTFSSSQHTAAYQQFIEYKTRVPVRGAILLNHDMDEVVLVKGWKKGATWSFPRGKINKDEPDLDCAVREVWEETGYDIREAGLVPPGDQAHSIDVTMREQHLRMFVFRGVPTDTLFEPKTRKEISKIQWWKLAGLPGNQRKVASRATHEDASISASKLYMVAPFLPPLKKWIHQQRKLDAKLSHLPVPQSAFAEDVLSDSNMEPQLIQSPVPDPTAALKQMLSVSAPMETAALSTTKPDVGQANALLAMLRGAPSASLAPPTAEDVLPITPMEQITGFPAEPASPHYHHAQFSEQRTQQPPPLFPLSPTHQLRQDTARLMGQLGLKPSQGLQSPDYPHVPQPSQLSSPFHSHPNTSQANVSSHNQFPQMHIMAPPPQFPPQLQNMQSLQPQGQQGAIAHGPVAPKASQLPPPRLNNHTMGLLNAFKSPSFHQRQPDYNMAQGQQTQSYPSGQYTNTNPGFDRLQGHGFIPQVAAGHVQPSMPQPSVHQKSLLDMFRSPMSSNAAPAPQFHAPAQNGQQRASSHAVPPSQPPTVLNASEPPKQRSATLAMFNRSLPKAKAKQTPSPAPKSSEPAVSAKEAGDPDQPSYFPQQPTPGDMFPAKEAVMQTNTSSLLHKPSKRQGDDASKPPVTILARPASAATKTSPVPPRPDIAPTTGKTRPTKAAAQVPTSSFTLLQRPSNTQSISPSSAERRGVSVLAQSAEAPNAFQPLILTKPKVEEAQTSGSLDSSSGGRPQNNGSQRDALLALFNKSSLASAKSADSVASIGSNSAHSGGVASPPPASDAAAFRSRLASGASMVSNGMDRRDSNGLKSPATPVEAKDFLMGFLNGVVQNEHSKSSKRPQF
ncbi:hypothetical protein MBLNU459_g3264t1 [Dothideomycetes sp. NU459]